jgi:hypothetical protein
MATLQLEHAAIQPQQPLRSNGSLFFSFSFFFGFSGSALQQQPQPIQLCFSDLRTSVSTTELCAYVAVAFKFYCQLQQQRHTAASAVAQLYM